MVCAWVDAADEEEGESEQEEEDIFELEGQTEQLHLSPQAQPASAPERLQGRGGWEGAAGGDCPTHTQVPLIHKSKCSLPRFQALMHMKETAPQFPCKPL